MAVAALCALVSWNQPGQPLIAVHKDADAKPISPTVWDKTIEPRRVYPMSVVPGGLYSAAEARKAVEADPVVAKHYSGLNVSRLQPVRLEQSVRRYVSFRRGNQVYWTRRPVTIPAGETVLADQDSMVRARCGNRLSESSNEPVLPATERQPTDADLDTPIAAGNAPQILGKKVESVAREAGLVPLSETVEPSGERSPAAALAPRLPQSADATARGFRGFNALNGGFGSGLLAPSQNPALFGPEGIIPLNPESMVPFPPQVDPELPLLQAAATPLLTETVLAVLNPGVVGGTGTESRVSVVAPFHSPTTLVPYPVASSPAGGGGRTGSVAAPYNSYGEVSSPGLVRSSAGSSSSSIVLGGGSTPSTGVGTSVPLIVSLETGLPQPDTSVPEPGSLLLLVAGTVAVLGARHAFAPKRD